MSLSARRDGFDALTPWFVLAGLGVVQGAGLADPPGPEAFAADGLLWPVLGLAAAYVGGRSAWTALASYALAHAVIALRAGPLEAVPAFVALAAAALPVLVARWTPTRGDVVAWLALPAVLPVGLVLRAELDHGLGTGAAVDAAPWVVARGLVVVVLAAVAQVWRHAGDAPRERLVPMAAPLLPAAVVLAIGQWPSATPPTPRPSVLLLTVDTLRADVAEDMASVQRLAARGTTFTDALATSSWTVPSVGSFLTGTWPGTHGAGRWKPRHLAFDQLRPEVATVAERFRAAGYRTGAVVANGLLGMPFAFERGFDDYLHYRDRVPARIVGLAVLGREADGDPLPFTEMGPRTAEDDAHRVQTALDWVDGRDERPFFLWVHLIGPHLPYTHWRVEDGPLHACCGETPTELIDVSFVRKGNLRPTPEAKAQLREGYDLEVAHTDTWLTVLLDGLEARGVLDQLVVGFTSDHGEEFWEYGGFEHGHAFVPPVTHVPLVVSVPGATATRSSAPASIVDVPVTLLAHEGLSTDGMEGVDLLAPVAEPRTRRLQGTLYGLQREGVVRGSWAWVHEIGGATTAWRHGATWTPVDAVDDADALAAELAALPLPHAGADVGDQATDALKVLGYVD